MQVEIAICDDTAEDTDLSIGKVSFAMTHIKNKVSRMDRLIPIICYRQI
ncbi:MAG TPA: hypothetical protein VHP38_08135 [Ruminiclostridium sp.]|nr:hypothetical protein [Ruminiclostridium sp.]